MAPVNHREAPSPQINHPTFHKPDLSSCQTEQPIGNDFLSLLLLTLLLLLLFSSLSQPLNLGIDLLSYGYESSSCYSDGVMTWLLPLPGFTAPRDVSSSVAVKANPTSTSLSNTFGFPKEAS